MRGEIQRCREASTFAASGAQAVVRGRHEPMTLIRREHDQPAVADQARRSEAQTHRAQVGSPSRSHASRQGCRAERRSSASPRGGYERRARGSR